MTSRKQIAPHQQIEELNKWGLELSLSARYLALSTLKSRQDHTGYFRIGILELSPEIFGHPLERFCFVGPRNISNHSRRTKDHGDKWRDCCAAPFEE